MPGHHAVADPCRQDWQRTDTMGPSIVRPEHRGELVRDAPRRWLARRPTKPKGCGRTVADRPYAFPEDMPAPAPYAPAPPERTVVYQDVCLIDGTGADPVPGMSVVTRGQQIHAVSPTRDLRLAALADAEVVPLHGAYLMPGLIDSHQHLATPPNRELAERLLARQLYGGVTAIRDMADDLRQVADLARAARVGEIAAPDIAYAALLAGASFYDDRRTVVASQGEMPGAVPWMQAVGPDTDLRLAVAVARGTGARAVKIYADLDEDTIGRLVQEAHRQGLRAWAHAAVWPATPAEVVHAGVDTVSHAEMFVFVTLDARLPGYSGHQAYTRRAHELFLAAPADAVDGVLTEMRQRGTVLDATVSMWRPKFGLAAPGTADDLVEVARRVTARAHVLGVAVSAGTDYETELSDPFPALHEEIAFLADTVGMAPKDAIRSATQMSARALGMEASMGTVHAGKLANLVITEHDPLADLGNLRTVVLTVKRGTRFERSGYAPSTPVPERPIEAH
jgi:imidazolonepropionase-like amidohydrolase